MTEDEWLTCESPKQMIAYLREHAPVSDRKGRLIGCACCRRHWHRLDGVRQVARNAIEAVERFLEGGVSFSETVLHPQHAFDIARSRLLRIPGGVEYLEAVRYIFPIWPGQSTFTGYPGALTMEYAAMTSRAENGKKRRDREKRAQAVIIRDILGNPFRPVALDPSWLAWNDGTSVRLAKTIHQGRAYEMLPILADALEDAGCQDSAVLEHCRQATPHFLGCWVIDLLLGKE